MSEKMTGNQQPFQEAECELLWKEMLQNISSRIPEADVNLWLNPLSAVSLDIESDPKEMVLMAHNQTVRDWVVRKYKAEMEVFMSRAMNDAPCNVVIKSANEGFPDLSAKGEKVVTSETIWETDLEKEKTFQSFVPGDCNRRAYMGAMQTAKTYNPAHQPFVLYGGSGIGKTHILQAIGNEYLKTNSGARVRYLRANQFFDVMFKALQSRSVDLFREHFRSIDLLLLDDIHFLTGKARSQEELIGLLSETGKRRIVCTSNKPVRELKLDPVLEARLCGGLQLEFEQLDRQTRLAILKHKAEIQLDQDHVLTEDCYEFLADNFRSNVRELEGALTQICFHLNFLDARENELGGGLAPVETHKTAGRCPTVTDLREWLGPLISPITSVDIVTIQKTVAEFYHVSKSELCGKSRKRGIVSARHMAMYLCKQLTSSSFPDIGDKFVRDHTTVMHAVEKITKNLPKDTKLQNDYEKLKVKCINQTRS